MSISPAATAAKPFAICAHFNSPSGLGLGFLASGASLENLAPRERSERGAGGSASYVRATKGPPALSLFALTLPRQRAGACAGEAYEACVCFFIALTAP